MVYIVNLEKCLIAMPRPTVFSKCDTTKLSSRKLLQITYWVKLFCLRPISTPMFVIQSQ